MLYASAIRKFLNILPVFLVLAVPIAAAAQCPVNTVFCVGEACCSGGIEFDETETSMEPTHGVSFNNSSATYDLVEGRLYAVANVDDAAHLYRCGAIAVDVFELNGVPAATFKVRLSLSMWWVADPSGRTAWAEGEARITSGLQSAYANSPGPALAPSIEIELSVLEGEPFEVTYETTATAWGYYPSISMTCNLHFVDLPPGAVIASCNGFGEPQTPVARGTWGMIKELYR